MELNEALSQITEIHTHLARTEVFRGFRWITVASSAVVAVAAGLLQAAAVPSAAENVDHYLLVWLGAAAFNLVISAITIAYRSARAVTRIERETTLRAVEQFAPSLLAGAIVTAALYSVARESCWLLPGLWTLLFSLGVFACYQSVDTSLSIAAAYYLLAGMAILVLLPDMRALSPWVMATTFGAGQAVTAGLLYWRLERGHA